MKKIIIALIFVLILTGCKSENLPADTEAETPSPTLLATETIDVNPKTEVTENNIPVSGGSINISMRPPMTMNPLLNSDVTVGNVLKLVFEDIFVLDSSNKPVPNLTEYVLYAENGLDMTVKIRNDIFWSDGVEVNADDLIFSFGILKEAENTAIYKDVIKDIVSMEKIDNYTVLITNAKPTHELGYMLLFPIIPRHYYADVEEGTQKSLSPLGNGIYKHIYSFNSKKMEFVASNTTFKQKPYIQRINILITPDSQTDFYAFEQNVIDFLSADILDFGKYNPLVSTDMAEYDTNCYEFIGFNFNNAILRDLKVRQAISHLVDKDYLLKSVYLNHGEKATSVVSPKAWNYEADVADYKYSVEMANTILFQGNYVDANGDGILEKSINGIVDDFKFKLIVNEENIERIAIANYLKSSLEEVGISVEIIKCDFDTYLYRLNHGEFDLFVGGYNFEMDADFLFAFHSSMNRLGANYFNYESDVLDGFLVSAQNAATADDYVAELSNIQKHIALDLPVISIAFRKNSILFDSRIKGDKMPMVNNIFMNINSWYVE